MKTIIMTGVSGGIGLSIANELLSITPDLQIFNFSRNDAKLNNQHYQQIFCDLAKPLDVELTAKQLLKKVDKLHGIILTAGMGKFMELEQLSLFDMQTMLNINFLSQVIIVKLFLPLLKKTPNSKIIAIGSESALAGAKKGTLYCASKFALRGFLQSLRAECCGSETAVSIINPGLVRTPFFNELAFEPGDAKANAIEAEQVAKSIALIWQMQNNCVFEEINLQPMKKVLKRKM